MPRKSIGVAVMSAMVVAMIGALADLHASDFPPKSALPPQLRDLATDHQLDHTCPPEGQTTSQATQLQNEQKNNFAIAGGPVTVTLAVFPQLQQAAEQKGVPFGSDAALPKSRAALHNILNDRGVSLGEGTIVRYVATIVDAHFSNTTNGETVNCKHAGNEDNDIHIMLGQTPSDEPCQTVTAEISPHFRSEIWAGIVDDSFGKRPLRFTGPLLFDASHRPCEAGHQASPPRISLWEIHPLYAIDVCRNMALVRCSASDESAWVPLHEWIGNIEQ